jgi:dihydrofolate reductase
VDTFVLTTVPVVLGSGTRLFDGVHVPLEVEQSWTSDRGTVVATYRVVR